MASNAICGVGTQFKRESDTSSGVFYAIAEVNSIGGPNKSRGFIDVTSLDSTGGYREFVGSFRDAGEVALNMNFSLDTYNQMNDDFEADVLQSYQIVLPDAGATTLEFTAFVSALGLGITLDDKVTADVTLKISGPVTITT